MDRTTTPQFFLKQGSAASGESWAVDCGGPAGEVFELQQQIECVAAAVRGERPLHADGRAGLRASETHLALVRDHYENIRANVVYAGLDRRGRGRIMISAELPILYLQRTGSEPPRISYPEPAGSEAKPPRKPRQSKIEPEPWLESLPVHRYLPGATAGRRR